MTSLGPFVKRGGRSSHHKGQGTGRSAYRARVSPIVMGPPAELEPDASPSGSVLH